VTHLVVDRVRQTIDEHNLIGPTETVLAAVSGGPDSCTLLLALHELHCNMCVAHLHHGLRGADADEDANFVVELCRVLDVPVHVGKGDVRARMRTTGQSTEHAARDLRYQYLFDQAEIFGAHKIATGHTKDDQAETVLQRIVRGTGSRGLAAIPYSRDKIIRPLLDCSRSAITDYLSTKNVVARIDSSNFTTEYSRNRVRHELLPLIQKRFNTRAVDALVRLSAIASAEYDYMSRVAAEWLDGRLSLPISDLEALHTAVQRAVITKWLERHIEPDNITLEIVEAIRGAITSKGFVPRTLPGGELAVRADCGHLVVAAIHERSADCLRSSEAIILPPDKTAYFDGWELTSHYGADWHPNGNVVIRTKENGDRISMPFGTKKLQDIFVDHKVAREERSSWPVICDDRGILVVPLLARSVHADGFDLVAVRTEKSALAEGH
jgi:tRNA(Ile)-lysidine synthase